MRLSSPVPPRHRDLPRGRAPIGSLPERAPGGLSPPDERVRGGDQGGHEGPLEPAFLGQRIASRRGVRRQRRGLAILRLKRRSEAGPSFGQARNWDSPIPVGARRRRAIFRSAEDPYADRKRNCVRTMGQQGRYGLGLLVAVLSMLAIPGCAGDDVVGAQGDARSGGSITISYSAQPDALDPALSRTAEGWEALWLVYTPLLTYAHAEREAGTELIPGLARDLPRTSEDGLTYNLTLRKGLRFSDGTPVKASDFEHTVKRVLNLESGGASYYEVIEGASEYLTAGKPKADISGIETNDRTGEITIRLVEPDGTFKHVLAMDFAGLVPGDTPFANMTKDPPPGVGPYAISESVLNRRFVMVKNHRFDLPDIPKGHLDRITVKIIKSAARQAQDVIRGELDYML